MTNAWKFTADIQKTINHICKPLEQLGFKLIYEKMYNNGSYLALVSHSSNILQYIEHLRTSDHVDYTTKHYMFEAFSAPESQFKTFLSPFELCKGIDREMLCKFEMHGGFHFFKRKNDYVESWSFVVDRPFDNISSFYLQNIHNLERFVHYFNLHTREFREGPQLKKLILPKLHRDIMSYISPIIDVDTANFLRAIKLNHYNMDLESGEAINLSKREIECLYHLSSGRKLKEIGRILGVSARTIETHIYNIKRKSHIYSRSKLISIFSNSELKFIAQYL